MTKAILRLIRDESLRSLLGMKGKERAKNFSWSISAQRHLDLFREGLS
jgi:glycosyltransferase involved in cell wall biosynthesis